LVFARNREISQSAEAVPNVFRVEKTNTAGMSLCCDFVEKMSRISGKITEKPVKIRQKLNRRPLPYQEKMCYYLNHKNVDCRATPVSH